MKGLVTGLLVVMPVAAAMAQTPPAAGGSIFDKAVNAPGIGWSVYGPNQTARQVPAAEVPGGAAVRVQVNHAGAHPWDVGAGYPTIKPIAAGDTLLVMVYLRAPDAKPDAGASVPIGAIEADPPFTSIAGETVKVGSGWKRYFAAGVASKAMAPGKARISLQLAGAKQVVEVGPAFLLDLGPGFDVAKLPHN
jgi:hypothetical protein